MFKHFIPYFLLSVLCTTAAAEPPSPPASSKKQSQSFFEKFQTLRQSFDAPTPQELNDIESEHLPVDYDVEYVPMSADEEESNGAFTPTADEVAAQNLPPDVAGIPATSTATTPALPAALPASPPSPEPSSATPLNNVIPNIIGREPKIEMPKLYIKDLITSSEKKEKIPSIYYRKKEKSPSKDPSPAVQKEDLPADYDRPKKRPDSGYHNQRLPSMVNKKEYSKDNNHLPTAYYVNEYKQILFDSAAEGKTDILRTLVDYFDNVDIRDEQGNTPLLYATMAGNINSVRSLLFMDADPNIKNYRGTTPLYAAIFSGRADLTALLLEHGADPAEVTSNNQSLLMIAATLKNKAIMEQLFAHTPNMDVNAKMANGDTILHHAIKQQSIPMVQLLLKHGANPNTRNSSSHTPLMLAAYAGNAQIVDLLLQADADPDEVNNSGYNATQVATARGFNVIAETIQTKSIELSLNGHKSKTNPAITSSELNSLPATKKTINKTTPKKSPPTKKTTKKLSKPVTEKSRPTPPAVPQTSTSKAEEKPADSSTSATQTTPAPAEAPTEKKPEVTTPPAPTSAETPAPQPTPTQPPAGDSSSAPELPKSSEVPAPTSPEAPSEVPNSSQTPTQPALGASSPIPATPITPNTELPANDPKAILRYHLERMLHPENVTTSPTITPTPSIPAPAANQTLVPETVPAAPIQEAPLTPPATTPEAPATPEVEKLLPLDGDDLPPLPSLD